MARNNYSYEKRKRELDKKKKQEAKRLKKMNRKDEAPTVFDEFGQPIENSEESSDEIDES